MKAIICHHGKKFKQVFRCCELQDKQQDIHKLFWSINDSQKGEFYARTTERYPKKRPKQRLASRRKFSFKYFFYDGERKVQVCRPFYLATLDISAKRLEWYHEYRIDKATGTPLPPRQGKHPKKCVTSSARQSVIDHINEFPRVESHYCRESTSKEFLDSMLSVEKMYIMYCANYEDAPPVKLCTYRAIFNTQFNLGFNVPKKDRCDYCEEHRCSLNPTDEQTQKYNAHLKAKVESKEERDRDRCIIDSSHAVICFDLENVISLPRANIKSFYFRRKLAVFNLTAHCSVGKSVYCALWSEDSHGRSGNDIASALIAVLDRVVADNVKVNNVIKKITLWSDACVSQNKNSLMSYALLSFLSEHPGIEIIMQKYGSPGHSPVQEVDNVHSQIERALRRSEVHSPISLVTLLKQVNMRNPFTVIEMAADQFFDYHSEAKKMKFDSVPFTKVVEMQYSQSDVKNMKFRTSFSQEVANSVDVISTEALSKAKVAVSTVVLNSEKVNHIQLMLKYMPDKDANFYKDMFVRMEHNQMTTPAEQPDTGITVHPDIPLATSPDSALLTKMQKTVRPTATVVRKRKESADKLPCQKPAASSVERDTALPKSRRTTKSHPTESLITILGQRKEETVTAQKCKRNADKLPRQQPAASSVERDIALPQSRRTTKSHPTESLMTRLGQRKEETLTAQKRKRNADKLPRQKPATSSVERDTSLPQSKRSTR